jgi:hypothetical protein
MILRLAHLVVCKNLVRRNVLQVVASVVNTSWNRKHVVVTLSQNPEVVFDTWAIGSKPRDGLKVNISMQFRVFSRSSRMSRLWPIPGVV